MSRAAVEAERLREYTVDRRGYVIVNGIRLHVAVASGRKVQILVPEGPAVSVEKAGLKGGA